MTTVIILAILCILGAAYNLYLVVKTKGKLAKTNKTIRSQTIEIKNLKEERSSLENRQDKLIDQTAANCYLQVPEQKLTEVQEDKDKKTAALLEDTRQLINQYNPNIPQLIHYYGNLGYLIGASMAGYKEKGPNLEEIKRLYFLNPTVDIAMMLQGLTITTWEEDYLNNPKLSRSKGETDDN